MTTARTTCPYCGVGCGVLATVTGAGVAVAGDPDHPANRGRLCSKGSALAETLGLEDRLLHPVVRGRRVPWEEALDAVAGGLRAVAAEHGPEAIGFYLSGQLLTEDYYVANKLAKGFIGTPHVDTNSRLCMASSVAGHRRAFGSDTVPGSYEDLDEADLLVLVGSNAAWCHPVLFRRMLDNRAARGARIVAVDPRRTATADEADLHLPIAPGTDGLLFAGLLAHLAASGRLDAPYIARHIAGFEEALERARALAPDAAATARLTGLAEAEVARFFALFAATERTVTLYSQGVNQSVRGTDTVNAILNVHLATGRIGRPGTGPFSLTGQPNAMGGREVGGLANMLAAHMGFSAAERDRVTRFWGAPNLVAREGHKAVALFDAVERGEIRALWIMATNPAVSLPDANRFRAALSRLDLLVVSENVVSNDTVAARADVLLPAAAWGEKDGTVTNSERRISRQRAFLDPPGETRPDWWALAQVARRLGFTDAFAYERPDEIFREHAALSAFENDGARDFDIGALANLDAGGYDALAPTQWPARAGEPATERLFAEGGFFTPDRRARLVPTAPPAAAPAPGLLLNTGRVRDHWHTMTRTGRSPRLGSHVTAPFVAVHPTDAERFGLRAGGFARVANARGQVLAEVSVTDAQRPGEIFLPIHWNDTVAAEARTGSLVHPVTDPVSGQPDAKATPVAVAPVAMGLRGFLLTALPETPRALVATGAMWWSRVALEGGSGFLLASDGDLAALIGWAAGLFPGAEVAEYRDDAARDYRLIATAGARFLGCLFVGPAERRPIWDTVKASLAAPSLPPDGRSRALSGQGGGGAAEGPVVCACFGVGLAAIAAAIRDRQAHTPEAIGALLRAGTNCGSCVPEIRRIVTRELAA
ncbi:MAG TPA: molybdopterin-dependent oxidoreductase [Microvirga sp.]|nr:molybdopterin-dependent oxidoreductase [Microvirga sp.]